MGSPSGDVTRMTTAAMSAQMRPTTLSIVCGPSLLGTFAPLMPCAAAAMERTAARTSAQPARELGVEAFWTMRMTPVTSAMSATTTWMKLMILSCFRA